MNKGKFHRRFESFILSVSKDQFNSLFFQTGLKDANSGNVFYCISALTLDILFATMSTVQEIKKAVRKLPLKRRLTLVKWIAAFDNDEWDKEMSEDAANGKLDFLVREGKEALKKGRLQPFPRP